MKRMPFLGILGFLLVFIYCENIQSAGDVSLITKEELRSKLGSPNVVLLDVRVKSDWEESKEKIKGAVRKDPETADSWAATLPKDKEIVLYCA